MRRPSARQLVNGLLTTLPVSAFTSHQDLPAAGSAAPSKPPGPPPTSLRRNATRHRWDTNPRGSSECSPQLNLCYPLSKDFPGHGFRSGSCPKHNCLSVVSPQAERVAEQARPHTEASVRARPLPRTLGELPSQWHFV